MKIKHYIVLLLTITLSSNAFGQKSDSLNRYLEIAAQSNPGVKANFLAYQASLQKISQVGAWEDPKLDIGVFLKPMDIIDGRQVANFTLMQMFPWFGTKKAAQLEMTHMSKMAFEQFRETRDNLYLDVYTQWFILCSLQQKLMNNEENKKLLLQLEKLALRKFSSPSASSKSNYSVPAPTPALNTSSAGGNAGMSGMNSSGATQSVTQSSGMSSMSSSGGNNSSMGTSSSGMSDVLRIQLEITELESNIESIRSEIKSEKAKLNALLNRSGNSEIDIPDSFKQIPFIFDSEVILNKIKEQNPMLRMINEEGMAYKAKTEMNKKMSYPMFGIGLQYMLIAKSKSTESDPMGGMNTGMGTSSDMSSMNGKDMIMPMISITLPIHRKKYNAQQKEGGIWWQASQEKYTNTLNILEAELHKTKHLLEDASRKIILYDKQIKLAQTTYNLIIKEFVSGKSDLTNVIQVQRQLLNYQLNSAEAVANYNTMVAATQKLISSKQDGE